MVKGMYPHTAFSTSSSKRHNDLVSNGKVGHFVPLLHDFSNEFMTADESRRTLQVSPVEMQIRTTEGCGSDFEDCVCGLLESWDGTIFDGDFVGFLEDDGSHRFRWHLGGVV